MTQEDKQLLLTDICARLPYEVKCAIFDKKIEFGGFDGKYPFILDGITVESDGVDVWLEKGNFSPETIKPYLRPMSSVSKTWGGLTEEEIENPWSLFDSPLDALDYFLENHIDFRGLIPMGLALEAPPGMYDKEESEEGSDIPVPKTVDEAISTLEKILSDEDREYLLKNGAISMHDSLGRWIRNEWGLWTGSELKNELEKKGLEHPDDMSNYIIEEFIKYLNNKV